MGVPISSSLGGKVEFTGTVPVLAKVEVPDVQSWSKENTSDNQPFVSSQTGGQTKRLKGNQDNSITVNFLLDDGTDLPFAEGDKGSIEAFTRNTGSNGGKWTGDVIIGSITADVNPGDGSPVAGVIVFDGDGALTFVANV